MESSLQNPPATWINKEKWIELESKVVAMARLSQPAPSVEEEVVQPCTRARQCIYPSFTTYVLHLLYYQTSYLPSHPREREMLFFIWLKKLC